jgi:hypothetical protein
VAGGGDVSDAAHVARGASQAPGGPHRAAQAVLHAHGQHGDGRGGAVQVEFSLPIAKKRLVSTLDPEIMFPGFKFCFEIHLVPLQRVVSDFRRASHHADGHGAHRGGAVQVE